MKRNNYLKKVKVLMTVGIVVLALSIAVPANTQEKVVLEYWHGWTGAWTPVIADICDMFGKVYPDIKIKSVVVPYGEKETKFLASVAAGTPPDVLFTDPNVIPFAQMGAIIPVDTLMSKEEMDKFKEYVWPLNWQGNVYDGHIWSFYGFVDVMALYYNKGIFREVGLDPNKPPLDIKTLDEYAEKLTTYDARGNIDRAGFIPSDLWQWGNVFGGDFQDPDNPNVITVNNPKVVKALEWIASYSKKYDVKRITAFNASLAEERTMALDPLISERFAMQLMGQWKVIDIDKYAKEDFDYGVAPLPYPPGGRKNAHMQNCSGYGLIPKGTPHPEEALKFLLYWNGYPSTPEIVRDRAKIMVAGGWMPLAETVWEHPIVNDYLEKFPAFKVFADILRAETTKVLTTPAQTYYIDRLLVAEDKARLLQVTPKQALDTCTAEVQKELDRILKR